MTNPKLAEMAKDLFCGCCVPQQADILAWLNKGYELGRADENEACARLLPSPDYMDSTRALIRSRMSGTGEGRGGGVREIKFRAWCDKTKQIVYNIHNLYDCFGDFINSKGEEVDIYKTSLARQSFGDLLNSGDVSLMQYTGLKDKNGKEIYEGDIVCNDWHDIRGNDIGNTWIVKFGEYENIDTEYGSGGHIGFYVDKIGIENDQEGLANLPTDNRSNLPAIIGNIHENPELLK